MSNDEHIYKAIKWKNESDSMNTVTTIAAGFQMEYHRKQRHNDYDRVNQR